MTETEPDLLDYTEQAQALVSELQRLSSMRAALDDAAATLRHGQVEIQGATATLTEHAGLALATFDDAQKHGDATLTAAQARMNSAADLAETTAGVLTELEQLQGAARTLNNSREILAGAATMLAAKGHSIDAGADAISSSSIVLEGVRKELHATHSELHTARSDLAVATSGVTDATATLSEQAANAQLGIDALGRCEAALTSADTELTAARATLEQSHVQLANDSATLVADSEKLHEQSATLENASQALVDTAQQIIHSIETLGKAQRSLVGVAANAQEQTQLVRTTMERMAEDQSRIGMMISTLEHRQEQEHSAILALTAVHQRHSRELTTSLDQVQKRLVELQPVIQSLIGASSEQSRAVDTQKRQLAQIISIIRWSGVGLVASIVVIVVMRVLRLI